MKKQILIIGIIVLLVAVGLNGCTEKTIDYNKIILGTWVHYPDPTKGESDGMSKYTFCSNKSAYWSLIYWDYAAGTWIDYEITKGKLIFTKEVNNSNISYDYTLLFSEDGNSQTLPIVIGMYLTKFTKQEPRGIVTIEEVTKTGYNIYFGENITVDGYYNSTLNCIVSANGESTSALTIEFSEVGISLQEDVLYRFAGMLVSDFSVPFGNHLKLLIEKIELI
jgi:hypothetical protein